LCLSLFPWEKFRRAKAKVHDVNILDQFQFDAGSFYIMDRGYLDFDRLHRQGVFFVTRSKSNTTTDLFDQQHGFSGSDDCPLVSSTRASRTVLQMDQATSSYFGVSENAVKTQVWITISVYVMVAIFKNGFV